MELNTMKKTRTSTYRKITRAAYLLGVIFLLAGMMLSMINQPVAASTPARPTRGVEPPVVRTPEGPGPSNPSEPQPPSSNNPDNPGVPAQRIPGRNL